jgi:VWFA-related protein
MLLTLFKSETYTGRMTDRRALLAAGILSAATIALPGHLAAQAIQRSMHVSVLNEAGAPVPDLGPSDFHVREDNVAREVLKVEPATEPMQIAILIDNSWAARDDVPRIRQALPSFVAALTGNANGRKSEVAIIAIGERPTIFADYTFIQASLQKGIDRLWALQGSGAYLLDGIIEVCQGLKKREARRPVIVAITAEGQEFSNRQHDQVLDPLRATGATFYPMAIGHPSGSLSDEARNRNIVLDEGPRVTGGRRIALLTSMALDARLKQLADELTHQYTVTYARPQTLIPPEHVTVAAAKAGLTARGTLIKDEKGRM